LNSPLLDRFKIRASMSRRGNCYLLLLLDASVFSF
jgi:hypothetical protein